ncbi:MAG: hypothetical protein QXX30_04700 [Candidatus Aenigmatarchaeota archaeon]
MEKEKEREKSYYDLGCDFVFKKLEEDWEFLSIIMDFVVVGYSLEEVVERFIADKWCSEISELLGYDVFSIRKEGDMREFISGVVDCLRDVIEKLRY